MTDTAATPFASAPELVIVTGMGGAGRTEAMHVFEDLGFFCVDNLPACLIGDLLKATVHDHGSKAHGEGTEPAVFVPADRSRVAVACDTRNGSHFESIREELVKLRQAGVDYRIVYLDAADDRLIARYKSSRRRHPLCAEGESIAQGIQRERSLMFSLRETADYVIDTTDFLPQNLRTAIRDIFATGEERRGLAVTVYSFGFKYAAPRDADLVIDVRFLPNPYYVSDLRPLTGLDAAVRDFVMCRSETEEFLSRWKSLLDVVMPGYVAEGKAQLAIAIGCTGGQHRSVCIAEATGEYLKSQGYRVSVAHRDLAAAK